MEIRINRAVWTKCRFERGKHLENAHSNHISPLWRRGESARVVRNPSSDGIPHAILVRKGIQLNEVRRLSLGRERHGLRRIRETIRLDRRQKSRAGRPLLDTDRRHLPGDHVPSPHPAASQMAAQALALEGRIPRVRGIRILHQRVHPRGKGTNRRQLALREPAQRQPLDRFAQNQRERSERRRFARGEPNDAHGRGNRREHVHVPHGRSV